MQHPEIFSYYSKVAKVMTQFAKDREMGIATADGRYMKRPDTIEYPRDLLERVKNGAATFHCSVERWKNPMQLGPDLNQEDLDNLRKGWDLIIDIDAKYKLVHAKAAAIAICNFLKDIGIDPTVKFSGSRGFHIGVSNEAFPKELDFQSIAKRYPEAPQAIASFIRKEVRDQVLEALIAEEGGISSLSSLTKDMKELTPYVFVDIEKNWGNRHLFRSPFSLHQKTWLASVPIRLFKLKAFEPKMADPSKVNLDVPFLNNKEGEATELTMQALDWHSKQKKEPLKDTKKRKINIKDPIPEEFFPPCIKTLLNGIEDGKKRSIFTLATFLRCMNWDWEKIEKRLEQWNKDNNVQLSDRWLRTQIRWHMRQKKDILPANCQSDAFYMSIGICNPDGFCKGIKNPVNYAMKKYRIRLRAHRQSIKSVRKR